MALGGHGKYDPFEFCIEPAGSVCELLTIGMRTEKNMVSVSGK